MVLEGQAHPDAGSRFSGPQILYTDDVHTVAIVATVSRYYQDNSFYHSAPSSRDAPRVVSTVIHNHSVYSHYIQRNDWSVPERKYM